MKRHLLVMVLVGCGTSGGMAGGDDDAPIVDAPKVSGDGGGGMLTETTLACSDYTKTATAASGAKTVTTYRHAIVEGLAPTDDFIVVACYPASADPFSSMTCPTGSTCTGATHPPGQVCFSSRGSANVIGGKVTIFCGLSITSFDANGAMTSSSVNFYESVKLYR